jgi:hypothetical protein
MWDEMERSPALAAPGSNDYGNVGNRLSGPVGGIPVEKALSDAQFDSGRVRLVSVSICDQQSGR